MDIITFKTFDNPVEANIVKASFLDKGIQCFLTDENFVGVNPLYSNAAGGIKLKIRKEDLHLAKEVSRITNEEYKKEIQCPICGSDDVHFVTEKKNPRNWLSFILSLFTFTYPLYLKKKYVCNHCRQTFGMDEN